LSDKVSAVIRKEGSKFCIFSKGGKNLGCFPTRQEAERRLRQIEFFKNKGEEMILGSFSSREHNLKQYEEENISHTVSSIQKHIEESVIGEIQMEFPPIENDE
jgi:hypothetical protein